MGSDEKQTSTNLSNKVLVLPSAVRTEVHTEVRTDVRAEVRTEIQIEVTFTLFILLAAATSSLPRQPNHQ